MCGWSSLLRRLRAAYSIPNPAATQVFDGRRMILENEKQSRPRGGLAERCSWEGTACLISLRTLCPLSVTAQSESCAGAGLPAAGDLAKLGSHSADFTKIWGRSQNPPS